MKNPTIANWFTYGILLLTAFLFVFLFSCTTSPLYEHYPFWFHGDSGIFQEMGVCLLQGGTPYVDLFDHKGPILWFIQALGIWISPHWGLMALQSISLFFSMLIWYRSILLLVDKQIPSLIIPIVGLLFLFAFYERGNLCEEWSLLFISLPIYLYIKRWKTTEETKAPIYNHTDAFIIGLCVGIIAMIRLNNTAPIVGFVLWHFIKCIQQKEFKRLWTDIAIICGGMAIIIILCSTFYLIKAGWTGIYEMLYGTFIFNYIYINDISDLTLLESLLHYATPTIFLITTILFLFKDKSSSNICIPVAISLFVSIFAVGHFDFWHYAIIFIPLFVVSSAKIIQTSTKWGYVLLLLSFLPTASLIYNATDLLLFRLLGKTANTERNDGFHRFISPLTPNERKSVYCDGNVAYSSGMFADEHTHRCNRIICESHLLLSKHLRDYEQTHGIKDLQPIWVLTQSPRPKATDEYMSTHYTLADSIPGGEFDPIWCWKRIE